MSQAPLKEALRSRYNKWMRENIAKQIALANGHQILEKLKLRKEDLSSKIVVSVFVSKCPEISTFPLIDWLFEVGAEVHLPAWHDKEMWMCSMGSKKEFDELIASTPSNRIPMPSAGRVEIHGVEYDWIIIPGLVFDEQKHRLGYGYGHYDYFLSRYFSAFNRASSKTRLIGIAHDEQIHNEPLPFEEHDIQLDTIITVRNVVL